MKESWSVGTEHAHIRDVKIHRSKSVTRTSTHVYSYFEIDCRKKCARDNPEG